MVLLGNLCRLNERSLRSDFSLGGLFAIGNWTHGRRVK